VNQMAGDWTKPPVEQAIEWLIKNQMATYGQAARRFNVTLNNIRARVEYRHGSLAQARIDERSPPCTTRRRQCIICRKEHELEKHRYICDGCSKSVNGTHGGHV